MTRIAQLKIHEVLTILFNRVVNYIYGTTLICCIWLALENPIARLVDHCFVPVHT